MAILAGFTICLHLAGCATPNTTSLSDELTYRGEMSRESTDKLKAEAARMPNLRWLVVDSGGGDAVLGMELGQWVAVRGLNVRVSGLCASSCANYVFTAGRAKVIEKGSLVAWHGGAQNMRIDANKLDGNLDAVVAEFAEMDKEVKEFNEAERAAFKGLLAKEFLGQFSQIVAREKRFYQRIGVNPCIAMIGQLMGRAQAFWYLSVADMARFGVLHVTTQDDYLAGVDEGLKARLALTLLEVTDADVAVCPGAR